MRPRRGIHWISAIADARGIADARRTRIHDSYEAQQERSSIGLATRQFLRCALVAVVRRIGPSILNHARIADSAARHAFPFAVDADEVGFESGARIAALARATLAALPRLDFVATMLTRMSRFRVRASDHAAVDSMCASHSTARAIRDFVAEPDVQAAEVRGVTPWGGWCRLESQARCHNICDLGDRVPH
jgi:hypothetical protein